MDSATPPLRQERTAIKKTVLLVEDHFLTRWSAAECLRGAGYRVVEAINTTEAVGVINSGTQVDLVFSDINMPGGENGYALAQWLTENRPSIPVLLTSGDPEDPAAYASSPIRRFIRKPYEPSAVDQLLRSMLASSTI